MTRAAERPPATDSQDEQDDELWEHLEGETPDGATAQALNLAHRAVAKFPELSGKYKTFAGSAAIVSGALVALAGVAVARRAKRGQRPDEILAQITPDEIERAAKSASRKNKIWRMIVRVARRRSGS